MKFTSTNTLEATPAERLALVKWLTGKFPQAEPYLRDAEIQEAQVSLKAKLPSIGPTDVDLEFGVVEPG